MPFVRVCSLRRKSLSYVRLLATLMQIPMSIGFFWELFTANVRVPTLVRQDKCHPDLNWSHPLAWGSMPLYWFYHGHIWPFGHQVGVPASFRPICRWLCVLLGRPSSWISFLLATSWVLQSWFHGDHKLVPWHALLVTDIVVFVWGPSWPPWDMPSTSSWYLSMPCQCCHYWQPMAKTTDCCCPVPLLTGQKSSHGGQSGACWRWRQWQGTSMSVTGSCTPKVSTMRSSTAAAALAGRRHHHHKKWPEALHTCVVCWRQELHWPRQGWQQRHPQEGGNVRQWQRQQQQTSQQSIACNAKEISGRLQGSQQAIINWWEDVRAGGVWESRMMTGCDVPPPPPHWWRWHLDRGEGMCFLAFIINA